MTYEEWIGYFLGQGHSEESAHALAADAVATASAAPTADTPDDGQ
ncbi:MULTISPECIES: hypothetical protein [Nocardiaceae]|nr:hypothetical protein [Williamsia limnetica]